MISIRKAGAAALASTLLLVLPTPRWPTAATTAARWEIGAIEAPGADTTTSRRGSRTSCGPRSAPWIARRTTPTTPSPAAAVAALGAVTRHLTSATKSVGRRVSSGNAGGPAAAAALARTQGNVVDGTIGLFDGASDPIVAADAATLKAALDGRDALVAADRSRSRTTARTAGR